MNTKQKRVVVTLILALTAVATVGFSAAPGNSRAAPTTPDHVTCELVPASLSAIELLELIDNHCNADLVDRAETEIGWSNSGQLATEVLLESIFSSGSRGYGTIEYLAIVEQDTDTIVGPSISPSARSGAGDGLSIDYHNPSSSWADSE